MTPGPRRAELVTGRDVVAADGRGAEAAVINPADREVAGYGGGPG